MFCIPDFISATSSCCSCQIWLVLLIVFRNILIWVIGQNTLRNVFIRLCLWHWLTFWVNSEIINNDIQNKSRCIIPVGNQFTILCKRCFSREDVNFIYLFMFAFVKLKNLYVQILRRKGCMLLWNQNLCDTQIVSS